MRRARVARQGGDLRSMADETEREGQSPEHPLEQVLSVLRQLAWKCGNVSSPLDNAESALREALVARTKLDLPSAPPEI